MRLSIFLKSILFSILFLIADYQSVAQSPESMNYQAVIRDGSGNVLSSQAVGLRIKILQGSATGTSVYQETFTPTTNAYGSIAIQIGTGTVVSGTFNTIDWGANSYYVETAVDISGGNTYTVISTTQFVSVPYALYAKNARLDSAAVQGMIDASVNSSLSKGAIKYYDGNNWEILEIGSNSQLLTVCDSLPVWTTDGICPLKVGDTLDGGIVFYISQPGDADYNPYVNHGLISSTLDRPSNYIIGCVAYTACSYQNGITFSLDNGELNTQNWMSCCGQGAPAACANLNENGFSDWFLPSKTELTQLYNQKNVVGGFTNDIYWSSSVSGSSSGPTENWRINFTNGSWGSSYNNFNYWKARCIRKF
jgi:hypothetical protein